MPELQKSWEEVKVIILDACHMLTQAESQTQQFRGSVYEPGIDCYVLLHDATRAFCEAVSTYYGQDVSRRWDGDLPFFLLTHPERCPEALSMLEQENYGEPFGLKLAEA